MKPTITSLGIWVMLFISASQINVEAGQSAAHAAYHGTAKAGNISLMNPPCGSGATCASGLDCIDYGIKLNGKDTQYCDCSKADNDCTCKVGTDTYRRWVKQDNKCFLDNGELCKHDPQDGKDYKCMSEHKCFKIDGGTTYGFCRRSDASLAQITVIFLLVQSAVFAGYWVI